MSTLLPSLDITAVLCHELLINTSCFVFNEDLFIGIWFLFVAEDDVVLVAGYKVEPIVSKVHNYYLWIKLILLLLKMCL